MAERAPDDSASGRAARREGHAQSQLTGADLLQMHILRPQRLGGLSHTGTEGGTDRSERILDIMQNRSERDRKSDSA